MDIQIIYNGDDFAELENQVLSAYKDIGSQFKNGPESVIIRIHKTRKDFNKQIGRDTREWEVANASHTNEIDILHQEALEKYSSHSRDEFLPILEHEIAHLFIDQLSDGNAVPRWLDEGLASYVSGQYKNVKKQNNYIIDDFCEKLAISKGWDDYSSYCSYQIASLFVQFLVEKYSLDKIIRMIILLDKNYYYPNFKKIFQKIFNKNIKSVEKEFIKQINDK